MKFIINNITLFMSILTLLVSVFVLCSSIYHMVETKSNLKKLQEVREANIQYMKWEDAQTIVTCYDTKTNEKMECPQ